jgi:hypothetical protein
MILTTFDGSFCSVLTCEILVPWQVSIITPQKSRGRGDGASLFCGGCVEEGMIEGGLRDAASHALQYNAGVFYRYRNELSNTHVLLN